MPVRLFRDFHDALPSAGIGLLNVEELAHSGGDVGDAHLAAGSSMGHSPAEEEAGDVGIVGVPLAVRGSRGI